MYRSASVVLIAAAVCLLSLSRLHAQGAAESAAPPDTAIRLDQIDAAARLIGLEFDSVERDSMRDELRDARDAYTAAVFPDDIAARYDDYNGYHRARQWWTVAAVSLWALNAVDAGWGPRGMPRLERDGLSLSLRWTVRRPPLLSTR